MQTEGTAEPLPKSMWTLFSAPTVEATIKMASGGSSPCSGGMNRGGSRQTEPSTPNTSPMGPARRSAARGNPGARQLSHFSARGDRCRSGGRGGQREGWSEAGGRTKSAAIEPT